MGAHQPMPPLSFSLLCVLCALCVSAVQSVWQPPMTHVMAMPVRVFERRQVREAIAFAQTGGIALHFFRWSHPHFGTGEYCHVLSSDRDLLIEFGAAYGFPP